VLRLTGGLFAVLLLLSACAIVASGPLLSEGNVRRIADAEVRRTIKINPERYEASEARYNSKGHYWSVAYHHKRNKRAGFTVRVSDSVQNASIDKSDGGVFEGALTDRPDYH
jgi:hypothetical protein